MLTIPRGSLLVLLMAVTACASGAQGTEARRGGALVITAEEIRASSAANVLELIRSERPQWLRTRGVNTLRTRERTAPTGETIAVMDLPEIRVYTDGVRTGDAPVLRSISTRGIASVQFLTGAQATSRFGTDHPHGAIVITTSAG
jgi:hypothetical protein